MADKSIPVQLYVRAGGLVFVGRKKQGSKPGITSVAQFDRKMKDIHSIADEGCPLATKAIGRIEAKIEAVRSGLISKINVIDGRTYNRIADLRILSEEFNVIRIECGHFNSTTNKMMNTLVFYDEYYMKLVVDEYKRRGRVRKYQRKMCEVRRRIRSCLTYALEYQDFGYRGVVVEEYKRHKGYRKMVSIFGEPEVHETHKILATN